MSQSLLRVSDLKLSTAGRKPLLNGLSFDIQAGEILALVGGSGSGKSLTALALLRLLPNGLRIDEGRVQLAGQNLFALTETQMNFVRGKELAMVFQEPQSALNPVQTVGSQIAEALIRHQAVRGKTLHDKVLALLEEVGIPDPLERQHWYPHQLSGGQKQRVVIAIALACEPKLLIADEPTTALDVTIEQQILALLNKIRRERQLAVLLITHDMKVVRQMADRVLVLKSGELVESAPVDAFFAAPQHPYSQELLSFMPKADRFLPPQAGEPLLEVRDLSVWFTKKSGLFQRVVGHTKAVTGVSLSLNKGETLALVGESGSGKSTLGRAILGLESACAGAIHFDGTRLDRLSARGFLPFRKKIQIIFQDPFSSMNPRFTVREVLIEGMRSLKVGANDAERETRAAALLERVGLQAENLYRYPHEFSGGQRQRIAIARALAVEPELIICDEPTSALDLSIRGQVIGLLQELQQELGLAYLFITHDLSVIPQLAHKVAVMQAGQVVEQGDCKTVLTAPSHPYTQALLHSARLR